MTDGEIIELARIIANKIKMPYCWEDIVYRITKGLPLPIEVNPQTSER